MAIKYNGGTRHDGSMKQTTKVQKVNVTETATGNNKDLEKRHRRRQHPPLQSPFTIMQLLWRQGIQLDSLPSYLPFDYQVAPVLSYACLRCKQYGCQDYAEADSSNRSTKWNWQSQKTQKIPGTMNYRYKIYM